MQAANAFAKLSKCQQFTTNRLPLHSKATLQTLLQSYQNVSNSQLVSACIILNLSCKRFCKVIKMLAIHNGEMKITGLAFAANAFAKLSKCQQFTTYQNILSINASLQTLLQSYQNVSNSQLRNSIYFFVFCCKRFCKVIKMLAIHNSTSALSQLHKAANAFAKLSKCQQFTTLR